MLERVALHQTRLRTPGLGLDPKGVALGARGLVLLPGVERLVAFLALYTRSGSLEDVLASLEVQIVRSRLGAREAVVSFAADSSDRLDRVAEIARLAGGYTFTGTSRHFVQYRDAAAPFGYDAVELLTGAELEAPGGAGGLGVLLLYHQSFTQGYAVERAVDLRRLLARLAPHVDPSTRAQPGPKWLLAERGLGPALIAYLLRSGVDAEVGLAEWPPESSFDDVPVARYVFRVAELPKRMLPLLGSTPGLGVFQPVADGVGVELGFRHPVELRACPVFPREGLVLFRGHGLAPVELERLPALGAVGGFARVELREEGGEAGQRLLRATAPDEVRLPLRMMPTLDPWSRVTATWVRPEELPLLRRLAYVLTPGVLRRASVAFTELGAFVRHPTGIEAIPVGEFYRELRDGLYAPAGYDPLPAVSPDVLHGSLGLPPGRVAFLGRDARVYGLDAAAFVPLETALLESTDWAEVPATEVTVALETPIPELVLESPGLLPMRDVGREEA